MTIILIIVIGPVMPLAGGQGGKLGVQLTLFQPEVGGGIMPTTLLLAYPDLKI